MPTPAAAKTSLSEAMKYKVSWSGGVDDLILVQDAHGDLEVPKSMHISTMVGLSTMTRYAASNIHIA